MEELKLECLVEGYEGIYFEIGQVWETWEGGKLKVKGFDYGIGIYLIIMTEVGDSTKEYNYYSNGEKVHRGESKLDLVKLIPTEEFDQMFEQKATTKYMVFVEGRSKPKKVHNSYDSAEKEAKRLSAKEISCNVMVLSVVKTFKSKVIVEVVR